MEPDEQTSGSVTRPDGYEFRGRGVGRLELRARRDGNAEGDQGAPVLWGAIPYRSLSVPLGFFEQFREQIEPGAMTGTVTDDNIVALYNHADDNLLGRSNPDAADTLRNLRFDDTPEAMTYEVDLDPAVELDRMVANRVERGILEGNSFGFAVQRDEWNYPEDGTVERTLLQIRLFDVGPVTFPAYPASSNELRSFIPGSVEEKIRGMIAARNAHRRAMRRRLDAARLRELSR